MPPPRTCSSPSCAASWRSMPAKVTSSAKERSRVRHSTLIRAELEDTVAVLTPAARAVFEDIKRMDEDAGSQLPEGFDALTPPERTSVIGAAKLLDELAKAEEAEEAEDLKRSEDIFRLRRRLRILSALISLAFLIVLCGMWVSVYTAPPTPDPADTLVTTPDEVTRYLEAYVPGHESGDELPVFIPTGLYIESVQFKGAYDVVVSGYIWQRYADDLPQDLDKGFVMPEAQYVRFSEVYQTQQGNEELIGWAFQAMLREQFDYHRYPLGRQQIWLQLWHKDFERNVYLAPDLEAYTSLAPATLPGVDSDLVLENWDIQQSFYSYRANSYNANFGIQGYEADQMQPELYYNISMKRYLLSALVSRMIVPIVILIQLFVIVMVIGRDSKRLELFGVRPGAVIFTCAAFFFAVLVAQNSLRSELQATGFVYLESLYLLTYFVILAVAINSVLLVAQPNLKLFRDYDNIWAEISYWPAILLTMCVITFLTFH